MATRVTLPPAGAQPTDPSSTDPSSTDQNGAAPLPVSKVQLTNDRRDRAAEAAWLRRAERAGVVTLLSTTTDPFTIITAYAGATTLRTAFLEPDDARRLMVQVAELVASLHRDDLVHGKLTVDHVIIGPDGPVLCSPDGRADDPDVDLAGLARCLHDLARQWADADTTPAWIDQWTAIADRLAAAEDPARSALRTAQALRRVAPRTASPATPERRRPPLALAAGAAAMLLAVGGTQILPSAASTNGPQIVVGDSVYAVGQPGDDVVHLERPCDDGARVVALRPDTAEVWTFSVPGDGEVGQLIARIPGATALRVETDATSGCQIAVATGPAGRTTVETG